MNYFKGKKIIIGICGGIASYKIPFLVRKFVKEGAEVKILITPSAENFVSNLTLSTLSKNKVYRDFVNEDDSWSSHVDLGLWADIFIIAPATLNTIGKMANGICDNLLLATYFSIKTKNVFICPAMDLDMYIHPSTKINMEKLISYGNYIIPVEKGELASGLEGEGRMAEPQNIINFISDKLNLEV